MQGNNKFRLENGAYRVTGKDKDKLKDQLLEELRIKNELTPSGKLSKGSNFPNIYIDGKKNLFRNRGGFDGFAFATQAAVNKQTSKRLNNLLKSFNTPSTDKLKEIQQNKDIAEMNMFTGGKHGFFREHGIAAHWFKEAQKNQGINFESDDLINKPINDFKGKLLKDTGEQIGQKWNSWRVSLGNEDPIFMNKSKVDVHDPDSVGVKYTMDDMKAHSNFLDTGTTKGLSKANKSFIKFALSERAPSSLPLDKQRLQFMANILDDKEVSKSVRKQAQTILTKALKSAKYGKWLSTILDGAAFASSGNDLLKVNNLPQQMKNAYDTVEAGAGVSGALLKNKLLQSVSTRMGLPSLNAWLDHSGNERIRKKVDPTFTGSVVGGFPGAPIGFRGF